MFAFVVMQKQTGVIAYWKNRHLPLFASVLVQKETGVTANS